MIMNNNLSASKTTWLVVDKAQSGAVCLTVNRRLSLRQAVSAGRPLAGWQRDGLGSAGQRHRGGWVWRLNWCIHWGTAQKLRM